MWPIFLLCTLSNVLHYLHWMHVSNAISNAGQKTFSMCTHFAPVMLWFMMELPGVFHLYFLLSSYCLPMQYFNPIEFRCWTILCQSTTTHIITFHHPFRDTLGIHVGTPHLHHPRGQGLVINLIITSAAPTIVKTRLFPMAQTQKPTSFVLFAWAHTHNVYTCNTSRTWDVHHPTMAKRSRGDLHLWENNMPICMDWQRPWGCISTKHNIKHICLGCGTFTHRAHSCPCTQKYPNIVDSLHLVSISVYYWLPLLNLHLIRNPSLSLQKNSTKLYTMKYRKDNTLAQFQGKIWKLLSALSSHPSLNHPKTRSSG